jgi:hypothetical protein
MSCERPRHIQCILCSFQLMSMHLRCGNPATRELRQCRWIPGYDTLPCGNPQNGFPVIHGVEHSCQDTSGLRRSGRWAVNAKYKDPRRQHPRQAFGEWHALDNMGIEPKDDAAFWVPTDPWHINATVAGTWVSTPRPPTSLTNRL